MNKTYINITSDRYNATIHKKYLFSFKVGIKGTSILRMLDGAITFYQDGSNQTSCPIMLMNNSFLFDKSLKQSF